MVRFVRTQKLIVLAVPLTPVCVAAQELRPRSILVLDQSDLRGPFYHQVFSGLRTVVAADTREHTTLYAENLDLSRFGGPAYEDSLQRYLKEKYRDRQIGVIVAVGAAALELVLHWRAELWSEIPIVFAMVDEMDYARLKLPSDVTGGIVKLGLTDTIAAARAVVPRLETIAFVGDAWERRVIFRNWDDEIPTVANGLNVAEIIGPTMAETHKKVAELPDDSAIIYSATYSDGEGTFYPPATALALIAEKANRPIIVDAETFLAAGGIGGFVLVPDLIGADAARLALRILDGGSPSNIPSATGVVKPLFNWGQMQRWQVSQSSLPPGSEIRFREAGLWEKYRWQSVTTFCIILLQAGLIVVLLYERKRRHHAESESRHRMSELAHVNRSATAGELSSSIAHELSQPLGAILTNTETAELILSGPSPDLGEVREILTDIRRDDLRANEVIRRLRSFLKRTAFETRDIDLNQLMREVFDFLAMQASGRNVSLCLRTPPEALRVKGDPIQLQQVMINLIVNSMAAMAATPFGRAEVSDGKSAIVSISDSVPGIPECKLAEVFDPFFTTKEQGMGIGLSIARTIIRARRGCIGAENDAEGWAVFHVSLPLSAV